MERNGSVATPNDEGGTEVMTEVISQDVDVIYTGNTFSELNHSQLSQPTKKGTKQLNSANEGGLKEPFDPDATYVDESLLLSKPYHSGPAADSPQQESGKRDEDVSVEQVQIDGCSQESTQTVEQSQEIETSPHDNISSCSHQPIKSVEQCQEIETSRPLDSTLELTPTQDTQDSPPDKMEGSKISQTFGQEKSAEVVKGQTQDDQSSICSSSQTVSSSSSSKRPTESDDTDDSAMASQDIFETQSSSRSSQNNNGSTLSQFLPTLQLSGDIPSSQSYEGFRPNLLCPSSPTSGLTSTPLRHIERDVHSGKPSREVISLSDEEDIQKSTEKRKLSSDSGEESKPELKRPKTQFVDSRHSVMIVEEISSSKKLSTPDSEDPSGSSQAFQLYISQTDADFTDSQQTEITSPFNSNNPSWKSHLGSACKRNPESGLIMNHNDSKGVEQDSSIVQIDDEDIQCFSPPQKKLVCAEPEIILDSSGPHQALSKSGDIEILSPADENRESLKSNVKSRPFGELERSFQKCSNMHSSSFDDKIGKPLRSSPVMHDENSKENIQPGKQPDSQRFTNEFVATFTCTYRVVCETDIDMLKKELIFNSIPVFQVIDSKTVLKRDSSPSAVEESSPSRGGGSPGSIASGPGPFALQPSHSARFSLMSTTSSSSTGSSVSNYNRRVPVPSSCNTAPKFLRGAKDPPVKLQGPVPWRELLHQRQDELSASGSEFIEKWSASLISNSSSDENKTTTEDRRLDIVPEDDGEEVFGVPSSGILKSILPPLVRSDALCSMSSTTVSIKKGPEPEEVVIKTETDTPTSKRKRGRPQKAATPLKTPRSSTKKKNPSSRKKDPEVLLNADQSSMPDDSSISSSSSYFASGSQVFAEWSGFYYPGKIESCAGANRWNVVFHDGHKKVLGKTQILLINTFEIGQVIQVKTTDKGDYEAGEVTGVMPLDNGEDLFTIKISLSGTTVTVPISELSFSEHQVKQYFNDRPTSAASTSSPPSKRSSASKHGGSDREILKNLDLLHELPGKRVRTPKGTQSVVHSPGRAGPSNAARRLIPDGSSSSTTDDEPLATSLASGAYVVIKGIEPEKVGFATADPLVRKGKGIKNSASKTPLPDIVDENIVKQLGPIPPEDSKIFAGYSFLITDTGVQPKYRRKQVTDSEALTTDVDDKTEPSEIQYPSDSECFKFTHCQMVKDRLVRQIIGGGGKVLKDWTEIVPRDINNTFVISSRPCLTPIFMHCVARGVKGVNHDYIIDCCRQGSRFSSDLKSNYLPVGYSHVKEDWVNWREHKSKSCLKGDNVLVVGNDKTFKAFWDDFLRVIGAKLSASKTCKGLTNVSMIVSENPCPESYLRHAQELGIPVVSPAWITQSLIANKRLKENELPSFAHTYVETD